MDKEAYKTSINVVGSDVNYYITYDVVDAVTYISNNNDYLLFRKGRKYDYVTDSKCDGGD